MSITVVSAPRMEARIFACAAGDIEAAVFGSGPAALLVHGTLGSWRQMRALGADLADTHTVILVSRPGYGATPVATGRGYEEQAQVHAALLDALAIDRAAVVGVSAGAPACVEFASRHPDRCSALVLCGPLAPQLASTRGMWVTSIPGVVRMWRMIDRVRLTRALRSATPLDYVRPDLSGAERVRARGEVVSADIRDFMTSTAEAPAGVAGLVNDIRNIRAAHRRPPARISVRARTLILHGDEDRFVPMGHGQYYASQIAGSRLEPISGGAHLFLQTFRVDATRRISKFLDYV